MHTLEPISSQIFMGIAQLFEFYVSCSNYSFIVWFFHSSQYVQQLYVVNEFFVASIIVPPCLAEEPALQPLHG